MPPNLFDKLLDALGLLPYGPVLDIAAMRVLWRRIEQLGVSMDLQAVQAHGIHADLEQVRARTHTLMAKRDQHEYALRALRSQSAKTHLASEQDRLQQEIATVERQLQQVRDDLAPIADQVRLAEHAMEQQAARQQQMEDLKAEILNDLHDVCLPLALFSCVAHSLGIDLEVRKEVPERTALTVTGEFARYDGSAQGAQTVLLCRDHRPVAWTTTTGTGSFRFEKLVPGEYTALVLEDTLLARRFSLEDESHHLQIGAVQCVPHLVRVRTESGDPLPGVTVVLCGFNMERVETIAMGETETSGSVSLPRRKGLNTALLVYRASRDSVSLIHTDLMPADSKPYSNLRLASLPLRAITYHAKTGETIPGVMVSGIALDGDLIAGAFGRVRGFRARADAAGAVDLHGPGPGRYLINITAPHCKPVTTEIVVAEDRSVHVGTFKIKPLKETGSLIGCIRDPSGRPCGGYVALVRSNGRPTGLRTFADRFGNFAFEGLAPGEYIIEVQGDRPAELGRRKITTHPNKRMEAIITLRHSLDFEVPES
ncbi:MAG: hypothetical protein R3301_07020 [Saprospiraceae bacterium]|nr:hypothetical protein [Saprospiraceae bacterium]